MCGITGFFSSKSTVNPPDFYQAHKLLRHRGPDDEGFVCLSGSALQACRGDRTIAHFENLPMVGSMPDCQMILGHHRLSIIDLTYHGHQPMAFKELRIVYNGEIYNYLELREELSKKGYSFDTQTDTEVFLKAYDYWGLEAFNRFIGMWAAAIFDNHKKTLLMTRDAFGIKPLYYSCLNDQLYFASEIKFLTALQPALNKPDKAALYDFIIYGQKDFSENTLYQNVNQVLPGEVITFDGSRLQRIRPNRSERAVRTYQSFDEVKNDVVESVHLHLRADVPVGISLSGGIDSSVVAGVLASEGRDIHSYSAVFPEFPDVDESVYIKSTLTKYQGKIHDSKVNPTGQDAFITLDNILWHMDEPYRTIGMILPYEIFQRARKDGVKVMLGGQGGDELFVGYRMQMVAYYIELFRHLKWFRLMLEGLHSGGLDVGFIKALIFSSMGPNNRCLRWLKKTFFFKRSRLFNLREPTPFERCVTTADPESRSYYFNFGLRDYLNNEDRMSMAHSVEARVPLLNKTLYDKAIGMPFVDLVHENTPKYWLRNAFKSVLSQAVYERRDKMGYLSPQKVWLENFKDAFLKEIDRCALWNDQRDEINQLIDQNDDKFWRVFITSRWYNNISQ